jgi:hypothetical protein
MRLYYKISLIATLLTFCGNCVGQEDDKNEIAQYRPRYISLSQPEKNYTPSFPISEIEIFDVRFDTSNAGLLPGALAGKEKLLRFKSGTSHEIREYYNSSIVLNTSADSDKSKTLVCFIKKLFISENIYFDAGQQVSSNDLNFEIKKGVMAVMEFYVKQPQGYTPLYRFDSILTGRKDIYRFGDEYIADILSASLRKLESVNWEKISNSSKSKSTPEIDKYYQSRFNIPILKEAPRRGIYLTFDNFRKNTPLDTAFTVDKTKKGDFLYVKNQKGEDILQTELWGYCDGKNMFIFSAENYFKLNPHGNTFIVYGAKDFTTVRKLKWNFGLLDMAMPNSNYSKGQTGNSYKLEFNLLQLDMEKGELY